MASRNFKVCDKCKKELETDVFSNPVGWKRIEIKFEQYNTRSYDLCPECLKTVGWEVQPPNLNSKDETIQDKLFEIIQEMVANVIQN